LVEPFMSRRAVTATYRLQFNAGFTFADAQELVPYLADLGVSHLYASPIFAARPGSPHGYDVIDPGRINPELGGEEGFRRLVTAAQARGLGLVIDIVPNHMALDPGNRAWMETLALGREAAAARLFDIDWSKDRIVLPVLADPLAEVVARGKIRLLLDRREGFIFAAYFDQVFPLRQGSVPGLLMPDPPHALSEEEARPIEAALAAARLADVLDNQHWRLAPWQAASRELTYRRFFNVNELIGVRIEDPAVFDVVHRLPLALLSEGSVDGLRVDHVDGLADPEAYCRRLREAAGPDALLVVEKILEPGERLRPWPIDGTTGYERLADINRLFVAPEARRLDAHLVERGLLAASPQDRVAAAKRQVLAELFGSEVTRLADLAMALPPVADQAFGAAVLGQAVTALAVHCPVYRSYATPRAHTPQDEAIWHETIAAIAAHEQEATIVACRFLLTEMEAGRAPHFTTALQQLTGPAMAKGLEDTEFYRSVGLVSVNEVGGDLREPTIGIEAFHRRAAEAVGRRGLTPLSTHDTKRGADSRARLNLLSCDPEPYVARAARWSNLIRALRADRAKPDPLDEWLLFQTLVGAWPISADRLSAYLRKAMREAKRHTRWEAPNEAYEEAAIALGRALVEDPRASEFRTDLTDVVASLDWAARLASLAMTILQLTLPGIPDIYQGSEFWELTLVDPDNRGLTDWPMRRAALHVAPPPPATDSVGFSKLHVMRCLLALRRRRPALFAQGSYLPVAVEGGGGRWIAFERRQGRDGLLVAVPTRPTALDTSEPVRGLPSGRWRNAIGDGAFDSGEAGTVPDRDWPFIVATRDGKP
jgi:(1->4)-alpha-D-glucan 1-alpha-D-glucosylmutase